MTQPSTSRLRGGIVNKITRLGRDSMVGNSIAIITSGVVTSALGYVFWAFAARLFSPEISGTAAASTSAIQATVLIASVGAAVGMVEWLPKCRDELEWRQRVTTGVVVSVVTAAAGALLVVAVLGVGLSALPQLGEPIGASSFIAACVFFSAGVVIDYVAVSEHRGSVLVIRTVLLSGLRIPLLFIPIAVISGEDHILVGWTVAAATALAWSVLAFEIKGTRSLRPAFGQLRTHVTQMAPSLFGQHLITVAATLPAYILPVVVYIRLSAEQNSYFYMTWMLGGVFAMISPAVSMALFVEGAANPSEMRALVRRCLSIIGCLLSLPMAVYVFGGGVLLSLFGQDYVEAGRVLLLLLTIAAIPDAVSNIAVSVLRVTGRVGLAVAFNSARLLVCVIAAWVVLPTAGIVGVGVVWLVTTTVGAVGVVAAWRWILGREDHLRPRVAEGAEMDALSVAESTAR